MTLMDLAPEVERRAAPRNDLLLRACRREPLPRPPVWIMRQAGRYLPEYRAVRARHDFLTMVRTPELATEVTLQPVDLIGVDAAVIFSDILVVPEAMGMGLTFDEGVGPHFDKPIRTVNDVNKLREFEPEADLGYVLDAIRMTRDALNDRVPLIGFAGAPWTLVAYMIEGGGSKNFQNAKRLLFTDPLLAHRLLRMVANTVGRYLCAQAEAGAQVLQLFESWGGALAAPEFRVFVIPYLTRVAQMVRDTGVPLIVYAPGASWAFREIARHVQPDAISVDCHADTTLMRRYGDTLDIGIQGNLDPCALYAPFPELYWQTRRMLAMLHGPGYIANLGHGVLPDTPPDNVRAFVDIIQDWHGPGYQP